MTERRDWASISPSARAILLVRAQTDLPYAREAATRLFGEQAVRDAAGDARIGHFELRAKSIDAALGDATSVLELASGLSFRGLALAKRGVAYVDTDLPDMVATKRELVAQFGAPPTYRLEALDAMDRAAVERLASTLPKPLTVVSEGLLVYLNADEKRALCETIRRIAARWVTGDVYVRGATLPRDDRAAAFAAKHDIDANKFASYDEARALFESCGFAVEVAQATDARATWVLS